MARRVFLHIGLPKTGTTFLQTIMWHNRTLLERQGFLYPGKSRMDHYWAFEEVRGASPRHLAQHRGSWRRLADELAAWPGTGLVSHEFFSMARPRQARAAVAALEPAEVTLVVTVRDYVLQLPAVWQEALKMNSLLSFDEFMDRLFRGELRGGWSWDSQDIRAVLRRWTRAVPPSRVRVVTVPPSGADPDLLWRRWVQAVEIDDTGFDRDVAFPNTSVGAPQAALLHRVKPLLSGPLTQGHERHRWVRQYFGHEVLVPQRGSRFGPRPHDVERLRERGQAAVRKIQAAGYQVIGDLDDLVSATPPPGPHPDDIGDAEIVEVAARAIEQMIRDVRELTMERDALRRARRGRLVRASRRAVRAVRRSARRRSGRT